MASQPPSTRRGGSPATMRTIPVRETRKATSIALLAWTVAVYDFILFGTLLPRISDTFGWSTSHALLVSTLVSVGTFIVVMAFGPIVDRFGRRTGMITSITGTALSSAATAAAPGAGVLVAVRSISGLGLAEQNVNATYLNEIFERTEDAKIKRNKGFVYAIVQTGWPLGALLAAGFVSVVGALWGPDQWRLAFILATIPAILIALLCRTLRESPQFEAQREIKRLSREGKVAEADAYAREVGLTRQESAPLKRIFQGKHLRNTIFLAIAWVFNWVGIQVFSVLGTTVLEQGRGVDASSTLLMVVVANIVGAIGYLVFGWAGDRFGRRNVIVVGWTASGIAFGAMLLGPTAPAFVLVTYMLGLFFMLGPYSAILFLQAECFDTDCRATGSAFIGAMSQPGAIVGGFALTALTAASIAYNVAAFWVGAIALALSGLTMLGVRRVAPAEHDTPTPDDLPFVGIEDHLRHPHPDPAP